jgi:hypothetical protein
LTESILPFFKEILIHSRPFFAQIACDLDYNNEQNYAQIIDLVSQKVVESANRRKGFKNEWGAYRTV